MLLDLMILEDYQKEGVNLKKLSGLKKGDIVIAKITKPVITKGANMIIDSLKNTFPDNKILLICDKTADVTFISEKDLNKLGWFYKKKLIK